jgi:hypothetical protein
MCFSPKRFSPWVSSMKAALTAATASAKTSHFAPSSGVSGTDGAAG